MSKLDGVKEVVWVATTRPSTDRVAWWLTAPNSIHADCGCPVSGTVTVREYTASFTSVKPCLYQPPPGTVIDVGARPAGVKLHRPARSTDVIAALPAVKPLTSAVAAGAAGACGAPFVTPSTTVSSDTSAILGNRAGAPFSLTKNDCIFSSVAGWSPVT